MTEFKGTPGPWKANGTFVEHASGDVCLMTRRYTDEVATANARLISAAPELLEALQEACETIQDLNRELNNHGGMIDDETFPKGLAAISKALGEGQ